MPLVVPLRGFLHELTEEAAERLRVPKATRPWLIVQSNNVPNRYGSVVACYTTSVFNQQGVRKRKGILEVLLEADSSNGMTENEAYIVCSNLYTIRHDELGKCIGSIDPNTNTMKEVSDALRTLLGI